jgi:uncharacterized protein YbaP (TraB family)
MYFKVSGTNVRVMGSLHMFPPESGGMPDWARNAYSWAEDLVFESKWGSIHSVIRSPAPNSLQHQLSPSTWRFLKGIWPEPHKLPPLHEVRPWVVMVLMGPLLYPPMEGVEPTFLEWAGRDNKPCSYLETANEFCAVFDAMPLVDVCRAIERVAGDPLEPRRVEDKLYDAWASRDEDSLYEAALQTVVFQTPSFQELALRRRNEAWVARLRKLIRSTRRTLVAVGAFHLYGSGNLFECLGAQASVELVR